jgi:hypothetical protein
MCEKEFKCKALNRKFCCHECSVQYRLLHYEKKRIKKTCKWCEKEFSVKPYNVNALYCCRACKMSYQRRNQSVEACASCGKPVKVDWNNKNSKRKYCCTECYFKDIYAQVEVTCAGCGKPMVVFKSRTEYYHKLYCSTECYKQYGLRFSFGYIGNKKYDLIRSRLASTAEYLRWKSYILKRDNYSCQKCGSDTDLRVHHIQALYFIVKKYNPDLSLFLLDKIRNSPEFKSTENGVTLCNSCHLKEHRSISPLIQ